MSLAGAVIYRTPKPNLGLLLAARLHRRAVLALGLLDQKVQGRAVCRGLKDHEAKTVGQVGHVDAGEGIIGQEPQPLTRNSLLDRLAQPQGRDGATMAARIDQDLIGGCGHGLALSRDAGHMALLGTRLAL